MNELQAIYTNNNGWGIQEASSELPSDVIRDFEQLSLTINETYDRYQGKYNQKIFVVKYMSGYVYYMCSDGTGFTDHVGRNNVLTHGYMFPINENPDIIRDDAKLISFSYNNFSDHINSSDCIYDESTDIFSDMKICGLDNDKLSFLLTCVYETLLDTSNQTLHIRISNENMIKPCMRCIYHFMPYSLRKEVSYSTIPLTDGTTTITFITPDFPVLNFNYKYIDLQTADNNISYLDAITDKTTFSSKFICKAADSDKHQYLIKTLNKFDEYEKDFKVHDNASISQRITILQVIYLLIKFEKNNEVTDKNVILLLNRLIRINFESPKSNNTLINLLDYCSKKRLKLNDSIMEALQKKCAKTKSTAVKDRIFDYTCENMLTLDTEKIAKQLIVSYTDERDYFFKVVECIRQKDTSPNKHKTSLALDIVFSDEYQKNCYPIDSLQNLKEYYNDVLKADFTLHPKVDEFIKIKLKEVFINYISDRTYSKDKFLRFYNDDYREYIKSGIVRNEDINPILLTAKKEFWKRFDIREFKKEDFDVYKIMAHDSPPAPENWIMVSKIMELIKDDSRKSLNEYRKTSINIIEKLEKYEEKLYITNLLLKTANEKYKTDSQLDEWCYFMAELSYRLDENPYKLAFKFNIKIMINNPDENYNNDNNLTIDYLEYLQKSAAELADTDFDFAERVQEISDTLNDVIKKRSKKKGLFSKFKK